MAAGDTVLGIDFGTSSTIAMLRTPEGRVRPLLFDASPLLASGVYAGADGELLTGVDAERAALAHPGGLEPNPKRRIGEGTVWLGERERPVLDLVVAVLRRVAVEATRVAGRLPARTVLTHPAGWANLRLGVLTEAAERAGLHGVSLVAEPVAAAAYFTSVLGHDLAPGQVLVVYDLGAGTFDVSVVRPEGGGYRVVDSAGLDDVGGLDLDAAVVGRARALTGAATEAWSRLEAPRSTADQEARLALWRGARAAKEQLSRHPSADLRMPLVEADLHLGREEFEGLARPLLDRTVELTLRMLRTARVEPAEVAGVLLVGGSSRVPLAGTLLHRTLGIAPTAIDQPELVVAEGALHTVLAPRPAPARRRRRAPALLGGLVVLAMVAAGIGYAFADGSHPEAPKAALKATPKPVRTSAAAARPFALGQGVPLKGHTDVVRAVAFSADGRYAVTGGDDETVRLWDASTGKPLKTLSECQSGPVLSVAVDPVRDPSLPDSGLILVGGDAQIDVYDQAKGVCTGVLNGHKDHVNALAFSPDGKYFASGSDDNTTRIWDATTQQVLHVLDTKVTGSLDGTGINTVVSVAFSPDGRRLLTGNQDGTARLWDVATGRQLEELDNKTDYSGYAMEYVAFSPDGDTVATGGQFNTARLWSLRSGRTLRKLTIGGKDEFVDGVAFSPDGKHLAVATSLGTAQVYAVASGVRLASVPAVSDGQSVQAVAFSPDGRHLVIGRLDDSALVFPVTP